MKRAFYRGSRSDMFKLNSDELIEVHAEAIVGRRKLFRYLCKKTRSIGKYPYANMGIETHDFISYTGHSHGYYIQNSSEFIWVSKDDIILSGRNADAKHILTKLED